MNEFIHKLSPWILGATAGLLIWTASILFKVMRRSSRLIGHLRAFESGLPEMEEGVPHGASKESLEGVRMALQGGPGPVSRWWRRLEHHLQPYQGRSRKEAIYLSVPPEQALPVSEIIDPNYPAASFQVHPGLITSVGLALTFMAILTGLYGVRYEPNNTVAPVQGIEGLINSLSGKFTTSIAALIFAALLTFVERRRERAIHQAYDAMVQRVAMAFPILSPTRVLVDLHDSAAERTSAIKNISSQVVDQFRDVFTSDINPSLSQGFTAGLVENLQPTLTAMTATLGNLEATIQRLESSKQESLLTEMREALNAMHTSLVESLSTLGRDFQSAMSGAAQMEFEKIQRVLESSAGLLEKSNEQFLHAQQGFGTSVGEYTAQIQDEMGNRMEEMQEQMAALGARMLSQLEAAQEKAGGQATEQVERISRAVDAAHGKLAELLGLIGERAAGLGALTSRFESAGQGLSQVMASSLVSLESFQRTTETLSKIQEDAGALLQTSQKAVEAQAKSAEKLAVAQVGLTKAQAVGAEILESYRNTFDGAKGQLSHMDKDLAKAFEVIHDGLRDWTLGVDQALQKLTQRTNDHLSVVNRTLAGTLEELNGKLEDFNESIDRVIGERA